MFEDDRMIRPTRGLLRRAAVLAVVLAALLSLCAAHAEAEHVVEGAVEHYARITGGLTSDEAAEGYINQILYPGARRPKGANLGAKLEGRDKQMYDILVEKIKAVAKGDGEEAAMSTEFKIPVDEILVSTTFTAEDLGVDAIMVDEELADDAEKAYIKATEVDFSTIIDALLNDLPYEMYWFDKTQSTSFSPYPGFSFGYTGNNYFIKATGEYTISFCVAKEYSASNLAGTTSFKTSWGQSVQTAADTAAQIVADNAGLARDIDKLAAYKKAICDRVEYNDEAANNDDTPYGNPWQLVWVFDGNASTNVVCEGYSKAFQYLCDLSKFRGNVSAICATGQLGAIDGTAEGSGAHMWNIVTMNNGKHYLVDVTNCDGAEGNTENSIGFPEWLFMKGYADYDDEQGVYFYDCDETGAVQAYYYYDQSTLDTFGSTGRLALSETDYSLADDPEPEAPTIIGGDWGENLTWQLDDKGTLAISGTGPMDEAQEDEYGLMVYPWSKYSGTVTKIVVGEGVTTIADNAFNPFEAVAEVSLPETLEDIGGFAFGNCAALPEIELPDGLEILGYGAFMHCEALTGVTLPAGLTQLGEGAFYNTGVTVAVAAGSEYLTLTDDGLLIAEGVLGYHDTSGDDIPTPTMSDAPTVAWVNPGAVEVAVPDGVEAIAQYAFAGCGETLTDVTIPNSVADISSSAFVWSEGSEGKLTIHCRGNAPAYAYARENLIAVAVIRYDNTLLLPGDTETIGSQAFANLGIPVNVRIPESVTHIADDAFSGSDVVLIFGEAQGNAADLKAYAENATPPLPYIAEP